MHGNSAQFGMGTGCRILTYYLLLFWGRLFKQQTLPKYLLLLTLLTGGGIQLVWSKGITRSSRPRSAGPSRSGPALQRSPSTSSPAPQQHRSQPSRSTVVTVCMGAEVTLERARGGSGWGSRGKAIRCCSRYAKIWISLATALS